MKKQSHHVALLVANITLCFGILYATSTPIKATADSRILITDDAYVETIEASHVLEREQGRTVEVEDITYPISEEEINLIALVTMGEAEAEPELGQRLVIDTILNRVDDTHFPDTVTEVVYQPNQFSPMWNGRIERCYIRDDLVELVKEELLNRTNYECVFFMAGGYSQYGAPMFQECCHYFSSYD